MIDVQTSSPAGEPMDARHAGDVGPVMNDASEQRPQDQQPQPDPPAGAPPRPEEATTQAGEGGQQAADHAPSPFATDPNGTGSPPSTPQSPAADTPPTPPAGAPAAARPTESSNQQPNATDGVSGTPAADSGAPAAADTPPHAEQTSPPRPADAGPDHQTPIEQTPIELSDEMSAAADAAMASAAGTTLAGSPSSSATGDPASPAGSHPGRPTPQQVAEADRKAHRAVRGPRVVESGREYREGVVVSVGPDDIFIEFGPKELGVLPRAQFRDKDGKEQEAELPQTGQTIKVAVDRFEAKESLYICSRPGAVQKADWELLQPGQIVEARVTGTNKGGLELEVANHKAFMPASLVSDQRIEDFSVFVGEKIECKVIKIDRSGRGNITLSRREVLAEEKKKAAEQLKDKLKEGDVVDGKVKKIMPFGAFVDIGGIDGLVHVSDISHDRVGKVENHLKEGQDVRVQILKLDWDKGRHSLGMKQLQDDPFDVGLSEINEGDIVNGRVTKLLDFGAFIEVASGIEGLCHISELDWRRIEKVSDAVQPDQIVNVKVLKIDKDQRRISLSVKQAKDRPERPGGRGGGGGRGRGRGDRDDRSPDEILKETPQLRRLREQAKKKQKEKGSGGLGDSGGLGIGLGDLKL